MSVAEAAMNEGMKNENVSEAVGNEAYQPQDWHAKDQRAVAEENIQNLKELPMNNPNADEMIAELDPADVLRKAINRS